MSDTYVRTDENVFDTWIQSNNSNNYVTRDVLEISRGASYYQVGLIRWTDLAGGSVIPLGRSVISATMDISIRYKSSASPTTIQVYRSLISWNSAQATGYVHHTGELWNVAGSRGFGTDVSADPIGFIANFNPTTYSTRHIPLQPYWIYQMINGLVTDYGFAIMLSADSPYVQYKIGSEESDHPVSITVVLGTENDSEVLIM